MAPNLHCRFVSVVHACSSARANFVLFQGTMIWKRETKYSTWKDNDWQQPRSTCVYPAYYSSYTILLRTAIQAWARWAVLLSFYFFCSEEIWPGARLFPVIFCSTFSFLIMVAHLHRYGSLKLGQTCNLIFRVNSTFYLPSSCTFVTLITPIWQGKIRNITYI